MKPPPLDLDRVARICTGLKEGEVRSLEDWEVAALERIARAAEKFAKAGPGRTIAAKWLDEGIELMDALRAAGLLGEDEG